MKTKVVGRRVAAFILDGLLVLALQAAIFFALAGDRMEALEGLAPGETTNTYVNVTIGDTEYAVYGGNAALYFLLVLLLNVGYWVVLQGLKGFTLGKLLLGIRVVRDDGSSPPGIGRAFGRWFLYIADAFPYFIPYLTGFIVAMVNKQNKRIGDMVGGTLVVDKDSVGRGPAPTEGGPTWVEGTRSPSGL